MPRIDAPSIAEHRARRRAALLQAAREVLLEDGLGAMTFATVARRAGLARNSVYDYFASRDDLALAVCEADFVAWVEDLDAAIERCEAPEEVVRTFVSTQLRFVGEGRHRLAAMVGGVQLTAEAVERMAELHHRIERPLVEAFRAGGRRDPEVAAALVQGVVNAGTRLVEAGQPVKRVTRLALQLVGDGLL